ncbi:reverse transcriptase domain-containing protein, partial [Tanacetum coccineum]
MPPDTYSVQAPFGGCDRLVSRAKVYALFCHLDFIRLIQRRDEVFNCSVEEPSSSTLITTITTYSDFTCTTQFTPPTTILISPGQPIPVGRPYRTQPNEISSPQMTHHEILIQIFRQRLRRFSFRLLSDSSLNILLEVMAYQIPLVIYCLLLLRGHLARDVGSISTVVCGVVALLVVIEKLVAKDLLSAGRSVTESRGGGTGGRVGRSGGRGRGPKEGFNVVNSQIYTRGQEAAVGMSWEDFKTLTREEFCPSNEMQKLETELWNHAMVGAGHAAYTDRFHELARLVPHLVTPKGKRIESKDRNVRDDNKRTRTGNAFASTTNLVGRENTGTVPKCITCSTYHLPGAPCHTCFNYNRPDHFAKNCRVVPRNVNPINARNPVARACYKCGSTDHIKSACSRLNQAQRPGGRGNQGNQARGRAFMLGAEEARQDPNIVTGTITLNDHYATTMFDSGVDYSFVSTTLIPLLGIEPSDLGFSYKIKIASGQLVEIDKVIRGCKLEIEGHALDINLIPFGSGSFDVIIGMDWLSDHKAEIICLKKVLRIPLLDGK